MAVTLLAIEAWEALGDAFYADLAASRDAIRLRGNFKLIHPLAPLL